MFFSSAVESKDTGSNQTPLTREQLKLKAKSLTYALPSLISTHEVLKGKRGTRRKKPNRGGEMLKFPSPQVASALNRVHNIIQTNYLTFTSSNSVPTATSYVIRLVDFDNAANIVKVFDQFKVNMVEIVFTQRFMSNSSSTDPGRIASVVDLDNSTALGTFNAALDYPGCQVSEFGNNLIEHNHTFVPHVAVAAYNGGFSSYMNVTAPWIDSVSTDVIHYGVKAVATVSAPAAVCDVRVRAWFQFRNVF